MGNQTARHTLRYLVVNSAAPKAAIVDATGAPSLGADARTALRQKLATAQADAAQDRAMREAAVKQLEACRVVNRVQSRELRDALVELNRLRARVAQGES